MRNLFDFIALHDIKPNATQQKKKKKRNHRLFRIIHIHRQKYTKTFRCAQRGAPISRYITTRGAITERRRVRGCAGISPESLEIDDRGWL